MNATTPRFLPAIFASPKIIGLLAVGFLLAQTARSLAAAILFTATDVADTTPGQDLWQYSYTPADFTFAAGQGFTIIFDRTLFTQIQDPPPFVNADWDPLTLQPDLALGSNGFYDALALPRRSVQGPGRLARHRRTRLAAVPNLRHQFPAHRPGPDHQCPRARDGVAPLLRPRAHRPAKAADHVTANSQSHEHEPLRAASRWHGDFVRGGIFSG